MPDTDTEKYPAVKYDYTRKYFDPVKGLKRPDRRQALEGGDHPLESPYEYDEEIILAVNAALATNRPLLVAGPAGTGKSALAANVAEQLGWHYEAKVITGRTEGRDLQWRFDTVRRLRDAHLAATAAKPAEPGGDAADDAADDKLKSRDRYIKRGVLWNAFTGGPNGERVVVLIDEIDKADPDVPNSLLEVLGNGEFTVDETGQKVAMRDKKQPFVVITTNDERELSRPFRRRCVTLALKPPDAGRLVDIAATWGFTDGADGVLAKELADEVEKLTPNVAEYLDALRACLQLEVGLDSPAWAAVKRVTLLKDLDAAGGSR